MLSTLQTNDYSIDSYNAYNDSLLYLDYINNNYEFEEVVIDPGRAHAYQGNLIGLFRELNIETSLYLFTMYINGINNPLMFDGKMTSLKLAIKPPIPDI